VRSPGWRRFPRPSEWRWTTEQEGDNSHIFHCDEHVRYHDRSDHDFNYRVWSVGYFATYDFEHDFHIGILYDDHDYGARLSPRYSGRELDVPATDPGIRHGKRADGGYDDGDDLFAGRALRGSGRQRQYLYEHVWVWAGQLECD
jgi:hypothetical protein